MTDTELYNAAKEAYYHGEPIMSDLEFDDLEHSLGLDNKGYIGSKYNPSYTIRHPYMMGSLSKVQVKYDKDHNIDWVGYYNEARNYFARNGGGRCVITPKYDGCSFEAIIQDGKITAISTRGDGEYGRSSLEHLRPQMEQVLESMHHIPHMMVLRGEVLVDKKVFEKRYTEFVNPRSFVAGVLNSDYTEELMQRCADLSIVIYEVRSEHEGSYEEIEWETYKDVIPVLPTFYKVSEIGSPEAFEGIYNDFAEYRKTCRFTLDGFVIKPDITIRENNDKERPDDCVAIKFTPALEQTEVIDIEWSLAKTGELKPVIITKPVHMDGKTITRASAHNYGYVREQGIGVGCKVTLSLAGDIIPYIYNVDESRPDITNIPEEGVMIDGCHLYKILTTEERSRQRFLESADSLSIPGIGPAAAETVYNYMKECCKGDDFLGEEAKEVPTNILCCNDVDICNAIGGKNGVKAQKSFRQYMQGLTLSDIIVSCNFEGCGRTVAQQIENMMLGKRYSFEHLASKAYTWALSDTPEKSEVESILFARGLSLDSFKKEENEQSLKQIPIIMTGEPNTCKTKSEFLKLHPEYCNTTSWKDVKIVFTNDVNSRTSKMEQARKRGVEIRLY